MSPEQEKLIDEHITTLEDRKKALLTIIPKEEGDLSDKIIHAIFTSERRSLERDIEILKLLKNLL